MNVQMQKDDLHQDENTVEVKVKVEFDPSKTLFLKEEITTSYLN